MKKFVFGILIITVLTSCKHEKKIIVDSSFVDSLITNYTAPAAIKANADEISFWKNRIDPKSPGFVNESKYAANLVNRFHLTGDIKDLKTSDSILRKMDTLYNHKEAAPNLSLSGHCILQHHFKEADSYLQKAKAIGIKKYESYAASFDVNFEIGSYTEAYLDLKAIRAENDYGYKFRQSKWEHYKGNMDSAINDMLKAMELSGSELSLKQAALSNAADLYLHNGELQKASDMYMQSIRLNAADLHSIMGLGWIVLVHDKNDSLAERIFQFVCTKTKSPDPLYKLIYTAEARRDSILQIKYATEFVTKVSDTLYGNMYNKYLIELYAGILHTPAKAEMIAKNELSNRATPQTYAWYAYALFINDKKEEAYKIYQQFVSGKPLEGLELYYMGKLMKGLDKGYNAKQFFTEAWRNRYDLSPGKAKELDRY